MKKLLLLTLLCPGLAWATECEHAENRTLQLDLQGVTAVRIEINSHDLRLGPASGGTPTFGGRACASSPELLKQLVLEQSRVGDLLVIRAERQGHSSGIFFKPTYAYLELDARLPASLAYEVKVGSGDAWVSGLDSLRVDVGSGDLEARDIAGLFEAEVGSGDITAENVGELRVSSVGSGDLDVRNVRGDARVGGIGSGDIELVGIGGNVEIGSIGSGDADIDDVKGDLRVVRVGSGDVNPHRIGGRVQLPADD